MKLSKTLMHTTAIMLLGTSVVYADSMTKETSWDLDADGRIESLPQTGTVSLSGTVASVGDEDTFTLKDKSGETIDIHTTETISFVEGARVKVQGQITDEAMGLGEEIKASSVNVLSANKTAAVEADSKAGLISYSSPMAKALIGKNEGDVALVRAPGGERELEIVSVEYN